MPANGCGVGVVGRGGRRARDKLEKPANMSLEYCSMFRVVVKVVCNYLLRKTFLLFCNYYFDTNCAFPSVLHFPSKREAPKSY